jgi:DNA repair exonuclease SbcCD ATPase subunit
MFLKVKNFRCYESAIFTFDDNGLVLLYGNSGKGKSSILMAINFALFGIGGKIVRRGETACSVELQFGDLKVVRTKRPNRLVVNDIYEDDVAQNIINEKFGVVFNNTGYIEQNATNSFIMMSPADKLQFLEKFAFHNVNLGDIKIRCKSLVARREMELKKTCALLESAISYLKEIDEPSPVEFPLICKNRDIAIKNEETYYKNCETRIKRAKHIISFSQEELNDLRVLNTYLSTKNENIDNLIESMEQMSIEKNEIDYIGDEELENYKNILQNLIALKEINMLKERLKIDEEKIEKMKQTEIDDYESEIEKNKEHLWEEYTKEEAEETINDLKTNLKDACQVSFLRKQISNIDMSLFEKQRIELKTLTKNYDEKQILYEKLKKQKICYKCPSCDKALQFCDEKLCTIDNEFIDDEIDVDELKTEITDMRIRIKSLEKIVTTTQSKIEQNERVEKEINEIVDQYEDELIENDLKDDLDNMKKYYESQIKFENRIREIKTNISENKFSSSITVFEKDIRKQKNKLEILLSEIVIDDDEIYDENEIRDIITNEEKNKEALDRIEKKKNDLERERLNQSKQTEIQKNKHIDKYKEIRNEDELNDIIKENENKIKKEECDKLIHYDNLMKIKEYQKYIEQQTKYDNYKRKVTDFENKEIEDTELLNAVLSLKEKIMESEMIAIMNTIETINTHAQMYLDCFFSDDPIVVTLKCFKESKKSDKPQINMDIYYKNDVDCDLGSLSGGELARVVLAFTLALSDMFNTPMLMLDECTASLDEETTATVFEAIKENMKGKPVLIIGHQIVQGIFDQIIKI